MIKPYQQFIFGDMECVYQRYENKKKLLIVIGDSWTWGDSLPKDTREDLMYGNLLSHELNADLLNIAGPGCSNWWMLMNLETVHNRILNGYYQSYENIYIVVCFTELFRDIGEPWNNYLHNDLFIEELKKYNIDNYEAMSRVYFNFFIKDKIRHYTNTNNLTFLFTRNFWDEPNNGNILGDYSWQDILQQKISSEFTEKSYFLSSMGWKPLTTKLLPKFPNIFNDFKKKDYIGIASRRLDKMLENGYNNKEATKHPTAAAHVIWSEHICSMLKNR